jgi:hypothetical protein
MHHEILDGEQFTDNCVPDLIQQCDGIVFRCCADGGEVTVFASGRCRGAYGGSGCDYRSIGGAGDAEADMRVEPEIAGSGCGRWRSKPMHRWHLRWRGLREQAEEGMP